MKLSIFVAIVAVIGGSFIAPNSAEAGCHPSLAAGVIVPILRVSGNLKLATQAARDEGFAAFASNPEWEKIWAKHPNENAYLHMNARFMKAYG